MKDSQELLKTVTKNYPNGVINVFDKNLNCVFADGMELVKNGIDGEQLLGTNYLQRLPVEMRQDIKQRLMPAFDGASVTFEKKTNEATFLVNAIGLDDGNGNINQILLVEQNISYIKENENHSQDDFEKIKELNESKSRLISIASHEFRTPLTSMLSSVVLLSKYLGTANSEEKQHRHLNHLRSSICYLTTILDDFLSLELIDEGKFEIRSSDFDVKDFTEEILGHIQGITKRGQEINCSFEGDTKVNLDKQVLKKIFINLMSNSIKYSGEEKLIDFQIIVKNDKLIAIIKDQGIGIPQEAQKRLFERYFRASNTNNIEGTGLGLNIIKKYIDLLGGQISFKSEEDKGTTFIVELPLGQNQCELINDKNARDKYE